MSANEPTNPTSSMTLGEYIEALIDALGASNPAALARMRQVVGGRRARIVLDDEAVDISFEPAGLHVQAAAAETEVDGIGQTDSRTVLALLGGYFEVADAILNGRLHVSGEPEDIMRMFVAIEILLDASPRTPALQALAARFQRERRERRSSAPDRRHVSWYPFSSDRDEMDLLARLDLLTEWSGSDA
ncbi:MAG: hypothetical protein ACWGPS_07225 [Candidatus Promineifilaceae bacterium]